MADTPGDASTLCEEKRSILHHSASQMSAPHSVDVAKAEEEFNTLARQLTRQSNPATKTQSYGTDSDIEKGGDEIEPFDLREYLTTSNDTQQQAGIKARFMFYASIVALCLALDSIAQTRRCHLG
ncbi:hypothetical protein B0H10DRAFT_818066 [Mycena sp. CBHHK59/15]|nr:hypothetical protein B0H10DRAFT_818066 [Mycena sp. CBHHK59/15]